jgi:hypothetical protein
MKNDFFIHEVKFSIFLKMIVHKINDGFVIAEWNQKLPFVVLVKRGKQVDHFFHFILSCVTLGLWTVAWMYLGYQSREKKILISIDEDGKPFEEKCYIQPVDYKLY